MNWIVLNRMLWMSTEYIWLIAVDCASVFVFERYQAAASPKSMLQCCSVSLSLSRQLHLCLKICWSIARDLCKLLLTTLEQYILHCSLVCLIIIIIIVMNIYLIFFSPVRSEKELEGEREREWVVEETYLFFKIVFKIMWVECNTFYGSIDKA